MRVRTRFARKRLQVAHSGARRSSQHARTRTMSRLIGAAAFASVVLAGFATVARADPFSIGLHATNTGLTSINSTITAVGQAPDGRQLFDIVIHEEWGSLAPGVLTFSNFPERSILDITKMVSNSTGTTWTSLHNVTVAEESRVPPFAVLFEAIEDAFFSNEASWQLTPVQLERCLQQFPTICNQPFFGNVFTLLNGRIATDTTARVRFALQLDGGSFTLTQTPDNAPVPEPSTLILCGTAGAAAWRARRRRRVDS
jgi:hypothetical protein